MLDLVCSGIFNFHGLLIHSDKIKKQLNKRKSETQRFFLTTTSVGKIAKFRV